MSEDHEFALCLTHDVDRPYKRLHQSLYYAVRDRSVGHLRSALAGENPYWQFEHVAAIERDLGVRSAFYVLSEPHLLWDLPPRAWLAPENWVQHLGRYDPRDPAMARTLRTLDGDGWEVGLHGSLHAATDRKRMAVEKARLESVLGHDVAGVRQHYLHLAVPETWEIQADLGFRYDASLGSATEYGFDHGEDVHHPFDREFAVLPLTLMEQTLPDPGADPDAAWDACEELLLSAADRGAVMTVLWHPRYFSESDFPGYAGLYRRLVRRAKEFGAWIGPPVELLDEVSDGVGAEGDGSDRMDVEGEKTDGTGATD